MTIHMTACVKLALVANSYGQTDDKHNSNGGVTCKAGQAGGK